MKKNMKEKFNKYIKDYEASFEGWDFSYLSESGRMSEFPLTWNYYNEIMDYCNDAQSMLDMGTGGGEKLSALPFLPKETYATEGYPPNIKIAKERLEPLGIKVYPIEDDNNLPLETDKFDLIINRHESYSVAEVKRILKNNGYFITQQIGGLNDIELNTFLEAEDFQYQDWNLTKASKELLDGGFEIITMKQDQTKTRFFDIGAVVYYLKAIPWQIPDFSVEKYYDKLFSFHRLIENKGFIDVTCHRFFIIASKKVK